MEKNYPITLSEANFNNEVLNSRTPVLVDFWAAWCRPCLMIAPVVEELASEYRDKIKIGKLDVDKNPQTAEMYNIRSIPTLLFFKDGKVIDKIIGAVPKEDIKSKIEQMLS